MRNQKRPRKDNATICQEEESLYDDTWRIHSIEIYLPAKQTMVHSYDGILCVCESLSHVRLFAIPWIITAHQPPLSVEFSMQEYWSGLPFPSLGDLPDPGIKPRSPTLQADSSPSEQPGSLRKYYSAINRNRRGTHSNIVEPWKHLLSERSQTPKTVYSRIPFI